MNQAKQTFEVRQTFLGRWLYQVACFMISCAATATISGTGLSQDGGKVDGALWTFSMTPHDKNLSKRSGMFRVNGMQIYQKSDMNKPGFDKKVGTKTQIKAKKNKKGKIIGQEKTVIQFSDLHSDGGKHTGMSGSVEIIKSKFGEWAGRYIDQDGLHWDFKCSRKQE